jgi:hypothetical protein
MGRKVRDRRRTHPRRPAGPPQLTRGRSDDSGREPGGPASGAVYGARDLPDIRNRLVEDLGRPRDASPVLAVYEMHARAGLQVPADPRIRDPARQAELLARNELTRLRNAAMFWISPTMTRLTLATAPTMPAFLPDSDDLPAPSGLIYFAVPVGDYEPGPRIFVDADGVMVPGPALDRRYQVCAATWGPWDQCGWWQAGGTWFTFYTEGGQEKELSEIHGLDRAEAARLASLLPPLRIDNEAICPASMADLDPGGPSLEEAVREPGSTAYWMHLVLCAFRLMASARATKVTEESAPRPARKRAKRARVERPDEPVNLVDVAPGAVQRPQGEQEQGEQEQGEQEQGRRKYDRWTWAVRPHWRNQWYPKRGVHKPILIDLYIKGIEGKPFKEKVRVFREHGEPTSGRPPAPRRAAPPRREPALDEPEL